MFKQEVEKSPTGGLKLTLTVPKAMLESSILARHKSPREEENIKIKGTEETWCKSFSPLLMCRNTEMDRLPVQKLLVMENHMLKSSTKLLESSLAEYEQSALVSLKSSLLSSFPSCLDLDNKDHFANASPSKCVEKPVKKPLEKVAHVCKAVTKQTLSKVSKGENHSKSVKRERKAGKNFEPHLPKAKTSMEEIPMASDSPVSDNDFLIPNYAHHLEMNFQPNVLEFPKFLPPEKDHHILRTRILTIDALHPKRMLLNASSASLIQTPNFKNFNDPVRLDLIRIADHVMSSDPEFVLKVALYTRSELNIRTTANFLLGYAANRLSCRPVLQKYFKAAICLPSDWIEVAEICQIFENRTVSNGSLPHALRKAMVAKFRDFDKYQISKYNKESSVKKKNKTIKKRENSKKSEREALIDTLGESDEDDDVAKKQQKKEKSTDCDSALIPLHCVHG